MFVSAKKYNDLQSRYVSNTSFMEECRARSYEFFDKYTVLRAQLEALGEKPWV